MSKQITRSKKNRDNFDLDKLKAASKQPPASPSWNYVIGAVLLNTMRSESNRNFKAGSFYERKTDYFWSDSSLFEATNDWHCNFIRRLKKRQAWRGRRRSLHCKTYARYFIRCKYRLPRRIVWKNGFFGNDYSINGNCYMAYEGNEDVFDLLIRRSKIFQISEEGLKIFHIDGQSCERSMGINWSDQS
jgi:hypothetical protein